MAPAAERHRASELVRREWRSRIEAEYRSAALTQHFTLWLIQVGASPDLIRDGLRIVDDELEHARLSFEVFVAAGGDAPPPLDRAQLGLAGSGDQSLEAAVVGAAVRIFCLGETVAVPLFRMLRASCAEPAARAALDRILVDEVRHRDFGWTMLDWLLDSASAPAYRALVADALPAMLAGLRDSYTVTDKAVAIGPAERHWGLAPAADYAAVLARCVTRELVPRFAERGIDARAAWRFAEAAS